MASPFMNPAMYEQFMKNVTPEQINFAKQKMNSMSDEELKNIAKMTGMGNVDPNFIRNASGQMPNQFPNQQQQSIPQTQQAENYQPFQNIVDIKEQGNSFFKKSDYEQASQKYFEAILEIEEKKSSKINSPELTKLEISCRMNYATSKSKLNDFEVVLIQAREVLKIEENPKAFFREGQALYKIGLVEKSLPPLEKAHQMLPNDNTVTELYQEVKEKIPKKTNQDIQQQEVPENESNNKINQDQQATQKKKLKQKKVDVDFAKQDNDPILKAPQPESYFDEDFIKKEQERKLKQEKEEKKKQINDDVVIEQEEVKKEISQPTQQRQQTQPTFNPQQQYNKANMSQYMDSFKNMSDDQLNQMCNMMQSMDTETLQSMYKAQGMEMTSEQIQQMRNMYKPETIKMVAQMQSTQTQNANPTQTQQVPDSNKMVDPASSMPQPQMFQDMMGKDSMKNIASNPEMISTAMNMLKSNPEMLKSMSSMLGENNPLSKYLKNSNPNDLSKMINVLGYLASCFTGVMKGYGFMKRNKIAIGIFIGALIVYKFRLLG